MATADSPSPTDRVRVRRKPERACYDRATVDAILDEALFCHVGLVRGDSPVVVPTLHARHDDVLYLHGSPAAGFVRDLADGAPVCVTASIVDGIVLARSARYHSLNYRSVVVHGRATVVSGHHTKLAALERLVEHVVPGRWPALRPVTERELRETAVLAMPLAEASAKVRAGPSLDPEEDRDFPVWAGVLPLALVAGDAVPDAWLPPDTVMPATLTTFGQARPS